MNDEFTGKSSEVYRVRVSLTRQRMVEHITEGWVPMPGDREQEISSRVVREFTNDERAARDLWEAIGE